MVSMKTIAEKLAGKDNVEAFVRWMVEHSKEFAADHRQYMDAMDALGSELGAAVADELAAIEQQCASNLLFSGWLGLKANLEHFIDPVARSFLDVDFEVSLREETAHRLPEYERAQKARDRFYSQLTDAQRETYEAVIAYTSHLDTVGPKLAHYFGYILGNELLPRVVPGYHTDPVLTMRYTDLLNRHFGKHFLLPEFVSFSGKKHL